MIQIYLDDGLAITMFRGKPLYTLGYIPSFLSIRDERSAHAQLDANYIGGWEDFEGFVMRADRALKYPDDPALHPIALIEFRNERIYVYDHAWVAIVQPDDSFRVARLD